MTKLPRRVRWVLDAEQEFQEFKTRKAAEAYRAKWPKVGYTLYREDQNTHAIAEIS